MGNLCIQITMTPGPLVYHFAWGTMRSKPVLAGPVARRLQELLEEKAEQLGLRICALELHPVLVYIVVEASPHIAPHSIVCGLKSHSSSVLRREFKELTTIPTLWTSDYLVAAGEHIQSEVLLASLLASYPPCRPPGRPRRPCSSNS